jgi:outer membrane biosynthesis protein TonB
MKWRAFVLVLLAAGCAGKRTPPPEPPEGRTSMRPIVEAEVQPGTAVPTETLTPIYASDENAPPEYPAYALRAGCRDGTIAVRVVIGSDGNVQEQMEVPSRPVPADACHQAFRTAAAAAVARWRFAPAFRQRRVPREGGGTRWEQEPVPVRVDFEFLFEVVDGQGRVRSR